jgi:hypothetical protein
VICNLIKTLGVLIILIFTVAFIEARELDLNEYSNIVSETVVVDSFQVLPPKSEESVFYTFKRSLFRSVYTAIHIATITNRSLTFIDKNDKELAVVILDDYEVTQDSRSGNLSIENFELDLKTVSVVGINVNDIVRISYRGFYYSFDVREPDYSVTNDSAYFEVDRKDNLIVDPLSSKQTYYF